MAQTPATIPHPRWRIPLLGDVLGIDRERPNQKTLTQFERLGPIYRRSIVGTDLTFVGNCELAEQALNETDWQRYLGRPIVQLRAIAGDGLFTADNDSAAWQTAHDALVGGFSQAAMRSYHDDMVSASGLLREHLTQHPDQRQSELVTNQVALEVIARAGFGMTFWGTDQGDAFAQALSRALAYTQSSAIPVVGKLGRGRRAQFEDDRGFLHSVISTRLREHSEVAGAAETHRGNLLDVMVASGGLSREAILDQVVTFLIAGHETTGNLVAFALFYLARDSAVLTALRAERRKVLDSTGNTDGELRYDDVAKLRQTRAVVSETLRLWPTAPGFFRAARTPTQLGPHQFAPGDWVFLLMLAVHRDKAVWGADADTFNAQRFLTRLPEGAVYRPFGSGPRACIGRQFALHEATLLLSDLADHFDISPLDDAATPAVEENLTLRPTGVAVRFSRR